MQGILAPGLASFDGCPINAGTTVFNAPRGYRVIDTTTGAQYLKLSPAGDNTCFRLLDAAMAFTEDFSAYDTTDQVAILTATGLTRATTANLLHHIYTPGGNIIGNAALGAGQTLAPAIVAAGLDIGGDAADDEGYEVFSHFGGATGRPFIVGLDPAFYFKVKLTIADISGTDTFIAGFRRAEVNKGALADYFDYCGVGVNTSANPGAIKIITDLNDSGTATVTDTTQTLADARAVTIKVLVSAAGVVTYQHDLATADTLAAPTVTAAFTLDNGDPVIPFVHFLNSADLAGSVVIQSWEVGYQA